MSRIAPGLGVQLRQRPLRSMFGRRYLCRCGLHTREFAAVKIMGERVNAGMGSPVSSKSAYEAWHERLAVDSNTDTPWHRLVKTHLTPARDLAGKRVLEIGCGRGGFACWLASHPQRPAEIVATDFAITAVQKGETFTN